MKLFSKYSNLYDGRTDDLLWHTRALDRAVKIRKFCPTAAASLGRDDAIIWRKPQQIINYVLRQSSGWTVADLHICFSRLYHQNGDCSRGSWTCLNSCRDFQVHVMMNAAVWTQLESDREKHVHQNTQVAKEAGRALAQLGSHNICNAMLLCPRCSSLGTV